MPIGSSKAERLALKLRSRCDRELDVPRRLAELYVGAVDFDTSPVEESYEPGAFQFEVEQREVTDVNERARRIGRPGEHEREVSFAIIWQGVVVVTSDLGVYFLPTRRPGMNPPSRSEIEKLLSCALRGQD